MPPDASSALGHGQGEGHGEPPAAAEEVASVGAGRLGGDGRLPAGLVHEDRAVVADELVMPNVRPPPEAYSVVGVYNLTLGCPVATWAT